MKKKKEKKEQRIQDQESEVKRYDVSCSGTVNGKNIKIERAQFIVPLQIGKDRFLIPIFTEHVLIKKEAKF